MKRIVLALVGLVASPAVFAQATALDVTAATAQLGEIGTGIVAVGGALLVAAAIAVGFKWLKGAIFG